MWRGERPSDDGLDDKLNSYSLTQSTERHRGSSQVVLNSKRSALPPATSFQTNETPYPIATPASSITVSELYTNHCITVSLSPLMFASSSAIVARLLGTQLGCSVVARETRSCDGGGSVTVTTVLLDIVEILLLASISVMKTSLTKVCRLINRFFNGSFDANIIGEPWCITGLFHNILTAMYVRVGLRN